MSRSRSRTRVHARRSARSSRGTSRLLVVSVVVVALAVVGTGVAVVATKGIHGGSGAAAPGVAKGTPAALSAPPLHVVATSPAAGATAVATDAAISVQFSAPLSSSSPPPTLAPAVAGSWQLLTPTVYTFVAAAPLIPSSTETITVPASTTGASGRTLGTPTTAQFTVATGGFLRLQQLLASLDYLPLSFTPSAPLAAPQEAAQPQEGTFAWRWNEPASLESLWTPGSANVITQGAVMTFESQHNMKTDGIAGPAVWEALLAAQAAGTVDTAAYNYVSVSEALPETVTVYSDGAPVYNTPANTGVAGALTSVGTFPVYLRYTSQTMSGTNPNGTKYVDPGIPWISYFSGGDALHGFVRASYGFPQSDGCVEMPPANAAVVWPLTPIGTLVTVA